MSKLKKMDYDQNVRLALAKTIERDMIKFFLSTQIIFQAFIVLLKHHVIHILKEFVQKL